jgi:hypothetical protein
MSSEYFAPQLRFVEAFLTGRDWRPTAEGDRFRTFVAPPTLGIGDVLLTLPSDSGATDTSLTLTRIRRVLSDIYSVPEERLAPVLALGGSVASIQMEHEDYSSGSVPFDRFKATVERLKKTLLDVATFVVTDEPIVARVVPEAEAYVHSCRFLQTEIGSFVANVHLPTEETLQESTLFRPAPIQTGEVGEKLEEVVGFVVERVFTHGDRLLSPEAVDASVDVTNVSVLRDIGALLAGTGADQVNISLLGATGQSTIRSGKLTDQKFASLDTYIAYAKHYLSTDIPIDITGRIVELRSRNPDRRANWVGIVGVHEGRETLVTFRMSRRDYSYAVTLFQRNRMVRAIGRGRRLRTQVRIDALQSLEELREHTSLPENLP